MKNETNIGLYEVFATVAILLSLLVVAGSTAFAREAESGGGSSSGSSSGSVSGSVTSGGNGGVDSARDVQERGAAATASGSASVDLRGDGTVEDSGADDVVNGIKLRGDGTVDDDQTVTGVSVGVDLRGDGTVDDNLPRRSGLDDVVNGVKLRGDGTVDDNSASSVGASGFDSARDIQERAAATDMSSAISNPDDSSVVDDSEMGAIRSLFERLKAFLGFGDTSGADSTRDIQENSGAMSISIERNNDISQSSSRRDSARDIEERSGQSGESPLVDNSGPGSSSSGSDDSSHGRTLVTDISDLFRGIASILGF